MQDNAHQKLWFAFLMCLMLSTQGKKARCHCDQLNKRKYSACPHPPSLILLPFPFTHGLCAVTWLWAVLKLWGRGWDFKERSGVGVYITVAIKGSHEIRALVMIGFVFRLVCCGVLFFFKKGGGDGTTSRLYPKGFIIQMVWNLGSLHPHTWGINVWILNSQRGAKWRLQPSPLAP